MVTLSNTNLDNSAQIISDITNAPLIAILVFSLINFYFLSFNDFITVNFFSILFSSVFPALTVIISHKKNNIHRDLLNKEDRKIPLIVAIISYILGTVVLYILNAPIISTALMFCYLTNTIIVYIVTLHWKISIHAMGMAGPTVALIFAFGPIGTLLGLLAPLVMWSRVHLKRHTVAQVITGFLVGFILTAIQMYLIINL